MIRRCHMPSDRTYPGYGGRGISVCDRWRFGDGGATGVECFYADMGDPPFAGASLDREDNDGNYEPGNCRWATDKQQARNRRSNHKIEWEGETICFVELSEKVGIKPQTLRGRIRRGDALDKPVKTVRRPA